MKKEKYIVFSQEDIQAVCNRIKQVAQKADSAFYVEIKTESNKTPEQHKTYFLLRNIILEAMNEWGNNVNEEFVHEFLKEEFEFYDKIDFVDMKGKSCKRKIYKSIATATKEELTEFLGRIVQWCYDNDIEIPEFCDKRYCKYVR